MTSNRETLIENAAKIFLLDPTLSSVIKAIDPKAFKQLEDALNTPETTQEDEETPRYKPATEEQVKALCDWLDEQSENEWGSRCRQNVETHTIEWGRRNIRIVSSYLEGSGRSVWGFIDAETGKIMKAATFKQPDPKRYDRGSIWVRSSWTRRPVYMV